MDGIGPSVAGAGMEKVDVTILLDCFVPWPMVVNAGSWFVFTRFQLPEKQEVLCTLKFCPLKRFHLSRRSWFRSDFGTFCCDEATLPVGMISSTLTTAAIKDMALQVGFFVSDSMLNKNHVDGSNQCYSLLVSWNLAIWVLFAWMLSRRENMQKPRTVE